MNRSEREIQRKLAVLLHAEATGNVSKTCRYFGISRETFYVWRRRAARGKSALLNRKPGCPSDGHPRALSQELQERILELRRLYNFGPQRLAWYLARYDGTRVSTGGVWRTLKRHGVSRLPRNTPIRSLASIRRYEKAVPGHHVQVDVKFLDLTRRDGRKQRWYQYTAIDDSTRIRSLRLYRRHTQKNAIDFLDHVVRRFPFRIRQIRTDNGHEFQAQFHWHAE